MHGQAVKDEHIACVDLAANPIASDIRSCRNLRDMKILILVMYIAETMRAFHNSQRAHISRAIVKRNPYGEAFGISAHESIILVCMNGELFAVWEDQPANRFRMNQKAVTHKHFHDLLQGRMVRQSVKRFEVEDVLVGVLERRVWIAAGGTEIGDALKRVVARQQPARDERGFA